MTRKEREKMVYDRFPRLPTERTCDTEKRERDRARGEFRKRLIQEGKEKREFESQSKEKMEYK